MNSTNTSKPELVFLVSLFLIIWSSSAFAWQVVSAENIPAEASALTLFNNSVMCGFQGEEEPVIRVINPETAEILMELPAPEENCYGLTHTDHNWFLGDNNFYQFTDRGVVEQRFDNPYERMRGLAEGANGELWTSILFDGSWFLVSFEPNGEENFRFRTALNDPGDLALNNEFLWVTDRTAGFVNVFEVRDDPISIREVEIFPTPTAGPTGITIDVDQRIILIDQGWVEHQNVIYKMDLAGEDAPKLLPISRHFAFGIVRLLQPERVNLSMFNVGNAVLQIESVTLALGESGFSLGNIPGEMIVEPGRFLNVPITFDPGTYFKYRDTLVVTSTDPVEPEVRIALSGLGIFTSRRLGVFPDTLDFGTTRADPWRDGSRTAKLAIFNMGGDFLRLDSLEAQIPDIFHFNQFPSARVLDTAESLWVDLWFTPHRGIRYSDTLLVFSNEQRRIRRVLMKGTGNDSVFAAGSVMWFHPLEEGEGAVGSVVRIGDVNDDDIDEVAAVGPTGTIYCLNGFGSDLIDVVWTQRFRREPFAPTDLIPGVGLANAGDLNGDLCDDLFIGSGAEDCGVYGIDGASGRMLWRWDARTVAATGGIRHLITGYDLNGDGADDPVTLIYPNEEGMHRLVRLDGITGHPLWVRNPGSATDVKPAADLDHDGVVDFVTIVDHTHLDFYSGATGRLIQRLETVCLDPILSIDDVDQGGINDLLVRLEENTLSAWSLEENRALWNISVVQELDLVGPMNILRQTGFDLNDDGITEVVGCDDQRTIFLLNPATGEAYWSVLMDGVSTLDLLPDNLNGDGLADLVIGFESGRIVCLNSADGSLLWSYDPDQNAGVLHLFAFEDIDLGLSDDVVALFEDGVVRCISSGGDLDVAQSESNYAPTTPEIINLYPNPFNASVTVGFNLTQATEVKFSILDLRGRLVTTENLGMISAGIHYRRINQFEQDHLPTGLYFFRIEHQQGVSLKRGLLLK